MSVKSWNIEKYREEHECDEHWQLRRAFMEKWKDNYSEERLVCLARVFANIEFMGCRYPNEVMAEIAQLSKEVAQTYRKAKMGKLQRTFVSASDAAEDRARGIKREGGVIVDKPPQKAAKIAFVPQGSKNDAVSSDSENEAQVKAIDETKDDANKVIERPNASLNFEEYISALRKIRCLNVRAFRENMFYTRFGRMVLLVRTWVSKLNNITASCQACGVPFVQSYNNGVFTVTLNNVVLAEAAGESKADARCRVEELAWSRIQQAMISVVVKQQFIAQDDSAISVGEISGRAGEEFGAPVDNSVAAKMMKLMGWKGGGLGADAQGIEEPIKPNFQMVNRAGLGSGARDGAQFHRSASALLARFAARDELDVDLVFSAAFSKQERATLHSLAKKHGLASRSLGGGDERFLVVKKKIDPFSIVRAVVDKGGDTPKYQVFIPAHMNTNR